MNKLLGRSKLFFKRNGSTILTCVGGVGVVLTSVMAVKATPKAMTLLEAAKEEKGNELTKVEIIKTAGPAYIPAILVGVSTIACIFGANTLNKRQQAALMSAYALLDSSYKDYREKVKELYGEAGAEEIEEELARDTYEKTDISAEDEKELFYDSYSRRYFNSTMENVIKAEYEINRLLSLNGGAYLNEFYEMLDIPRVGFGDYLGWSYYEMYERCWVKWLDFKHQKTVMDDGLECYILSFSVDPIAGFLDFC